MPQIQGLAAHAAGAELLSYKYDPGDLHPDDVEISITHCGICHSDLQLIDNEWGNSQYPFIPGHEIIGTVSAVGSEVRLLQVGQRVGVGWQAGCCGICESCFKGEEQLCSKMQGVCVGRNGGYADALRVRARFAVPIPEALASENAAPLLCGGITVYSPLRNSGVNPASRVAIVGIGGLGHIAVQFARAFGAEVTAFSTTPEKEAEARALGAHNFVNTREHDALKKLAGNFDVILTTINADLDWNPYIQALRPKGKMMFVGVPPSAITLGVFPLIAGQRSLGGSPIGSPSDLSEMLDVAARHGIKAQTELYPMSQANEAIARLKKNLVRYRAVLTNQ
jgi:alcohol/geraniol dehydrogenase (NADP+)